MKKLRQQAEEASYKALTSALSPGELHGEIAGGVGEDDYTLKDLKSDLSLIANVVLSVLATAGAVWAAASGWAVPARFAMAFTSSLVVCLAEVVVLGGYFRRIGEAKSAEKKMVEKKEVLKTWVMKEDSWSVQ